VTPPADPGLKALNALLKRLSEGPGAVTPHAVPIPDPALIDPAEPLLGEFLRSMLIWEATVADAEAALKRIARNVVDFNELRVCLPDEIVAMLGAGYPRVQERAQRLRAALNELFLREHAVTLQPIADLSKRDAKAYLDSLEGVPPFVSARVCLLCLGVHAAPVDDRILRRLVEAGVVPEDADAEAAAAALERKVRAGEMARVYPLLQAWADALPAGAPAAAAPQPVTTDGAGTKPKTVSRRTTAPADGARRAAKPAARQSRTRKGNKQ
jgi:hypothetical protein